jgi:hypothetical protein
MMGSFLVLERVDQRERDQRVLVVSEQVFKSGIWLDDADRHTPDDGLVDFATRGAVKQEQETHGLALARVVAAAHVGHRLGVARLLLEDEVARAVFQLVAARTVLFLILVRRQR